MLAEQIIDRRFELSERLGAGAMGVVYRALDRETGRSVALKLLGAGDDQAAQARFAREARLLRDLRHPAIVAHVADGDSDRGPYLAMEWLEGEDLASVLRRGTMGVEQTTRLALRLADALAFAHSRGIVHRDIKPSNIFLCDGAPTRAKLLDFGVARDDAARTALTRRGIRVGTPCYLSPEQVRGQSTGTPASDVFALGCVLYECLAGRRAFPGGDIMAVFGKILFDRPPPLDELRGDVPMSLVDLVERALAKAPGARPRDGQALRFELASLDDARAKRERGVLSGEERRTVSVVIARENTEVDATDRTADTLTTRLDLLEDHLDGLGSRVELLSDGTLLAYADAPGSAVDAAASAARTAIALRQQLPLARIGLATGIARGLGRAPVGAVIDRAVALLGAATDGAPPHPIRVDELTAGLLDRRFEVARDGAGLVVRGRREPLAAGRTLLGVATPLVGREREIEALRTALERTLRDARATAISLRGRAGIGKTRLCAELVEHAGHHTDVLIWSARSEPLGANAPHGLLAEGTRRAIGIPVDAPVEARRRQLEEHLARHVPPGDTARLAAFIGELVGAPYPSSHSEPLLAARHDARVMGDQILWAWIDWLRCMCERGGVLIVVDDVQWADVATVRALGTALNELHDAPIMVVAASHPDVGERLRSRWLEDAERIVLHGLSAAAAAELARCVLPGADDAQLTRLIERADGNIFFLEELLRTSADGRQDTPGTVLTMVQARLEELPAPLRRTLRAASIYGETFWRAAVMHLLGDDSPEDDPFDALIDAELALRQPQPRFAGQQELRFRHGLVRDAAYATLTEEDRQLGHRLAGAWLEAHSERDAAVIAHHLELGGDCAAAVRFYVRACQQALEASDLATVHERARRGIACGATGTELGELRLAQAEALNWNGDFNIAREHACDAVGLLDRGTDRWFWAVAEACVSATRLGDQRRLHELWDQLRPVPATTTSPYYRALRLLGEGAQYLGAASLVAAIRARMPDPSTAGDAVVRAELLAGCRIKRGLELWHVYRSSEELAEARRATGDHHRACQEAINAAYYRIELGDPAGAIEPLREAVRVGRRLGAADLVDHAHNNLGLALCRVGRHEEAIEVLGAALASLECRGAVRLTGGTRSYLAQSLHASGEPRAAEQAARKAVEEAALAGVDIRCTAHGTLGRLLLERGEPAAALAAASAPLADLDGHEWHEGEHLARLVTAQAQWALGSHHEARAVIATARTRIDREAAAIADPDLAARFLRDPTNAVILALADQWNVPAPAA